MGTSVSEVTILINNTRYHLYCDALEIENEIVETPSSNQWRQLRSTGRVTIRLSGYRTSVTAEIIPPKKVTYRDVLQD